MIKSIYQLIKVRKTLLVVFIILIFSNVNYVINQLGYIKTVLKYEFNIEGRGNVFDLISTVSGNGSAVGPLSLATFIIPTFIFILLKIEGNNTLFYLFRVKNRKSIWSMKAITVVTLSAIYSFVVVIMTYIAGGIYLGSFKLNWNDNTSIFRLTLDRMKEGNEYIGAIDFSEVKVLIMILALFLIGLIVIGFIVEILNNIITKKSLVFIIVYGGVLIESIFSIDKYLLINKIHFKLQYLINDGSYMKNLIYLISLLIFLYVGGKFIESEKQYM